MAQASSPPSWSLHLGTVAGIPVRIHITFFLFLALVASEHAESRQAALTEIGFVLTLFFCVVLHEFGHALMARQMGVRTRDIILYPFGGVASLLDHARPFAEWCIALAGPLVNVAIFFLLLPHSSVALMEEPFLSRLLVLAQSPIFLDRICTANAVLAFFNLIPAFPMDGGRIVRSTLALLGVRSATRVAARLGQGISLLFAAWAVYSGDWILALIAVVVFGSAAQERFHEQSQDLLQGRTLRDVMIPAERLQTLTHGMTIQEALTLALHVPQEFFPVLHGESVVGVVGAQDLIDEASGGEEGYVAGVMAREFCRADADESLPTVVERMHEQRAALVVIGEAGRFVGVVSRDKLLSHLLVLAGQRAPAVE